MIRKLFVKNFGVAFRFLIVGLLWVALIDWLMMPPPGLMVRLFDFFVAHIARVASVAFIAVMLPTLWQYKNMDGPRDT